MPPVREARELLRRALGALEQADTPPRLDEAALAEARARSTAEILQAQQVAAEAARRASAAEARLAEERRAWEASRRSLAEQRARDAASIDELTGALEGTRSELEQELVRHHHDIQVLEARLQTVESARQAEMTSQGQQMSEARDRLEGALGALEQADRRARDAEVALRQAGASVVALEVRAARAEEAARQESLRLRTLEEDLRQSRADLSAERKHHEAIVRSLQRQARVPAGEPRQRQAGSPPAVPPRGRGSRTTTRSTRSS